MNKLRLSISFFVLVLPYGMHHMVYTKNNQKEGVMELTSSAFKHEQTLPEAYTCSGAGVNPPLMWKSVPQGTKSLALIVSDPDAPTPQPWIHWIVFNIPAMVTTIAQGTTVPGAIEGKNTAGKIGYYPACPPSGHGKHHYHFTLYALDIMLPLQQGASLEQVKQAMKNHIVAETTLTGIFERK